jgi:UDP-GlcNAc:undecaprenyl-phosphate/decaprenyl-phosphate GlcNAc-1-phosphate transferase
LVLHIPFLVALFTSLAVAVFLTLTARWHERFTVDAPRSGPQKLHSAPTPRVGGIAIAIGFCVAFLISKISLDAANALPHPVALMAALVVPFAAGLYEDISKAFGAVLRLIATFIAAAIAYFYFDAAVTRFDVPPVDYLLGMHPALGFVFTLFCVGGVAHSYNLSDGLNGLLAGLALVACAGLATVSVQYGDAFIAIASICLAGATAGFAFLNFPRARLFAGDGGAYFIGTAIALLAILVCRHNPAISPWFVFVLVLYPFTDTTYAIVRRKLAGKPIMSPDAEHLHTLLARRLSQRFGPNARAYAALPIVGAAGLTVLAALWLPTNTLWLLSISAVFAVAFVATYRWAANGIHKLDDSLGVPTIVDSNVA